MAFLPDGSMLVGEQGGTIRRLSPPYIEPDPAAFLTTHQRWREWCGTGALDIAVDPNFENNHYFYVYYTLGTPNHDRLSRFTANATHTGTIPEANMSSTKIRTSTADHHGGAITFGNDGKIYLATGDNLDPAASQDLTNRAARSCGSTRTAPCRPIIPSMTAPGPTTMRSGRSAAQSLPRLLRRAHRSALIGDVGGNITRPRSEE